MALKLGNVPQLLSTSGTSSSSRVVNPKRVKDIFVHPVFPSPNDYGGTAWPVVRAGTTGECYFITKLPEDWKSLVEAVVVVLPDATETIQWDIEFQAARKGEIENVRGNDDLNVTRDVTWDIMTELDLLVATGGNPGGLIPKGYLKANDYFSLWFRSDTDVIQIIGLRLRYNY